MKRAIYILLAGTLGCGGGSWSNKDLEFYNALPNREELKSDLPVDEAKQGIKQQGLEVGERSKAYEDTKKAVQDFNNLLDGLLMIVEHVKSQPPTKRNGDERIWGPFPDNNHPGFEVRMLMQATLDENAGYAKTYHYELQFQNKEKKIDWFPVLSGNFCVTTGIRKGIGDLVLHGKALRDNGLSGPELHFLDSLEIGYITDRFPINVDMTFKLAANPEGISEIGFRSRELEDRSGSMLFRVKLPTRPDVQQLDITSRWLPSGAGVATGEVIEGVPAAKGLKSTECWSEAFTVTYFNEPWKPGSERGDKTRCVTVPEL